MTARIRTTFLAALALAVVASLGAPTVAAQNNPLIGYTDYELILVQMPGFRQVQDRLQEQAEQDRADLGRLQAQIEQRLQAKGEELQQRVQGAQGPVTDEARQRLMQQLQQEAIQFEMEQRQELEQAQQQRLRALSQRETELLQPLYDQLQQAINGVAEQRGLAIVVSSRLSGEPVLLYAGPGAVDITAEVMSRLGISMQSTN
jgi:outer membrane protein